MTTKEQITKPKIVSVRAGWAAVGDGWAVFGHSRDGAVAAFEAAARKHEELVSRTTPTVEGAHEAGPIRSVRR